MLLQSELFYPRSTIECQDLVVLSMLACLYMCHELWVEISMWILLEDCIMNMELR